MYTLRTVNEKGNFNRFLGSCYNSINRFEHPERFREYYKRYFGEDHVSDLGTSSDEYSENIIGFISTKFDDLIAIYGNESNYIMLEGETFEYLNRAMTRQKAS